MYALKSVKSEPAKTQSCHKWKNFMNLAKRAPYNYASGI